MFCSSSCNLTSNNQAMSPLLPLLSLLLMLCCSSPITAAQLSNFSNLHSPWRPTDNLTLLSPNHNFAAGFQPKKSSPGLFAFAIWVQSSIDKTTVWHLKGDISNSSMLTISSDGTLSLNDTSGNVIWNATGTSNISELVLGDEGNLVFGPWSSFRYAFNHPNDTDTILTNQPVPPGNLTLRSGSYQLVNGTELVFNGTSYWIGTAGLINMTLEGQLLMDNGNAYVTADVGDIVLRRLTLDPDGNFRVYSLDSTTGSWNVVWEAVQELCTILGTCGLSEICIPVGSNSTRCECPPGYQKASSNSCKLKKQYLPGSKFLRLDFVAFDGGPSSEATPLNLANCSSKCLANSSCIGYKYEFSGQRLCTHYFDQFVYGHWSPGVSTTYVRVASSETDVSNFTGMTNMIDTVCPVRISLPEPPKVSKTTLRNLSIIITLFAIELIVGISSFWAFLRKYSKYRDMARTFGLEYLPAGGPKRFSYGELKAATKDFSNVVGHGAYGMVSKGELPDGRIIAVKRLKNIGGGEAEFWAEVTIIARMHHLNLVRLWGFCAEKEQRMLVYEFVPNGSLDKFLFPATAPTEASEASDDFQDPEIKSVPRKPLLDWHIRYRIALGIARAIAYLHEECLEWVLHCDIKPENILLENDFCPKVSDFGLSKLTNKKEKVTMSRLRGTRGYMAPEWVIKSEPITAKADVYSFGMVLLEIVSGVRNFQFQRSSLESVDWYMPRWAFEKVYVQKKVEDILDTRIMDSYDSETHFALVERMVKTAMWCLQDRAEMRPSMGKVTKMLEGTVEITEPDKPRIFMGEE